MLESVERAVGAATLCVVVASALWFLSACDLLVADNPLCQHDCESHGGAYGRAVQ